MLALYPNIQSYNHFLLQVDEQHAIYVEEVGNPDGLPVIFLHGGPGSGCSPDSRRLFDPQSYRIILFDQRGAGQSKPHCSLINNTTAHLIADIEKIRHKLNIDSWVVYGGSWGSTLALLYAQAHSSCVKFLILRGIFLARPNDVAWLFGEQGAAKIFPEHYAEFVADIPAKTVPQIMQYYLSKFTGANELLRAKFAKKWSTWEIKCSTLEVNIEKEKFLSLANHCLSFSSLEAHYFLNNCFLQENQILKNMHKLANIPGIIIHGRYDMVCPVEQAYLLAKLWPNEQAELQIICPAGHSISEPLLANAVISATNFVRANISK
jgi:proline iminopeptidase